MSTLHQFSTSVQSIPTATSWYLADISEAIGRQDLFTKQSPDQLKALREYALIQSAVSSNRIEGVEVESKRIGTLLFGRPVFHDRDEEEVRGYRDALDLIHNSAADLPITGETIRKLHRLARGKIWDAGAWKVKDGDIIERNGSGRQRVRFRPVSAERTPRAMQHLVEQWRDCLREKWIHPLVALAAFNLDFLCVHPFRDGNGRVSRLLLLQCYHLGLEVGRYVSLEHHIEQNKERYYETLEQCSQGWHESQHDPWPFINYLLFILKEAYREFEVRLGQVSAPRGAKSELVRQTIDRQMAAFTVAGLEKECPGVSRDLIRRVLRDLSNSGMVICISRGPGAEWRKKG